MPKSADSVRNRRRRVANSVDNERITTPTDGQKVSTMAPSDVTDTPEDALKARWKRRTGFATGLACAWTMGAFISAVISKPGWRIGTLSTPLGHHIAL